MQISFLFGASAQARSLLWRRSSFPHRLLSGFFYFRFFRFSSYFCSYFSCSFFCTQAGGCGPPAPQDEGFEPLALRKAALRSFSYIFFLSIIVFLSLVLFFRRKPGQPGGRKRPPDRPGQRLPPEF